MREHEIGYIIRTISVIGNGLILIDSIVRRR